MLRSLASCLLLALPILAQTNFPPPVAPPGNPVTPDKVLLGMALFFEEQMSSSGTVACATCHDLRRGGIDARAAGSRSRGPDHVANTADDILSSRGVPLMLPNGQLFGTGEFGFAAQQTPRRAPTVINSGYHTHLGYAGNAASLEDLILLPPVNAVEMGHLGRTWTDVEQAIAAAQPLRLATNLPARLLTFIQGRTYPDLFQIAFGSTAVTQTAIVQAIASYLRTLNSDQSKYDLYQRNQAQLTAQEQQGLTLFNSPANGATSCRTCHGDFEARVMTQGPIAGQLTMTNSGPYGAPAPTRLLFHNVGVRPVAEDPGRQGHTGQPGDAGKFRVASLRNVELMAPHFHTGGAASLNDVIDFYDRGGDFHTNQAAQLTARSYTQAEKDALVALLKTLTDPRVAAGTYPFDQPTLGSQNGNLVQSIGAGRTTSAGQLVASAPFAPRLGDSRFTIALSGVSPGVLTFLMWDVALSQQPMPYHIDLAMSAAFSAHGIGAASMLLSMPGTGVMQAPLPLPASPGLHGVTLFTQWLVLQSAGSSPLATSNTLRIELQ